MVCASLCVAFVSLIYFIYLFVFFKRRKLLSATVIFSSVYLTFLVTLIAQEQTKSLFLAR